MLSYLKKILVDYKNKNIDLVFGRTLIAQWVIEHARARQEQGPFRILDFGCGGGDDLTNIKARMLEKGYIGPVELYGIECYPPMVQLSESRGIKVASANIEMDPFPFEKSFFDVVISNQTVEHTKEIFWIFSEVSRVLKPNGIVITGAPNLASLHNRLLLLFGTQPSSIEMLGPHVRGFTFGSFKKFIEADQYFKVIQGKGGHFYPLPRWAAIIFSKIFPFASASLFVKARRTQKPGLYKEVLSTRFFATPYFQGKNP